jgi:Terminase small subunit
MVTSATASTEFQAAKPPSIIPAKPRLTPRQEAFCHAMACGVGGAEASWRAGYSANGAKQRGAFLMRQPEIRIRIDEIRTSRRADHQAQLDEAAQQVGRVIEDAFETGRSGLALRAIEFRLKLLGVIQDKRIAHHYYGCLDSQAHPDADLEDLDDDPEEELDPIRFQPGYLTEPAVEAAAITPAVTKDDRPALLAPARKPAAETGLVTYDDLSNEIDRIASEFSDLLDSTALTAPNDITMRFPHRKSGGTNRPG